MLPPLDQLRADTPGCAHVTHFNNAGAALMPRVVHDATVGYLEQELRTGAYETARTHHVPLEAAYDSAARLLNCHRDEIAFIENATRAWDMAFYAIPFRPGDRILTATAEYASNYLAFLQVARRHGVSVEVVPSDEHGQLSIPALENLLDDRVKLIAITHVPTNGGLVNPAAAVGKVANAAGILYLLDACQSVGQMPIDVQAIGCDMLSATGRKYLRGPRGTGLLYVRKALLETLEPPFVDLHAATWTAPDRYELRPDARRFETWEANGANRLGLATAMDYALALGLENTYPRIVALAAHLRQTLRERLDTRVYDLGEHPCGIVTFAVAGQPAEHLRAELFKRGINVSITTPSHALLDSQARQLPAMVRASLHYYNTEAEIEQFADALRAIG